jgi:hypothetical protein
MRHELLQYGNILFLDAQNKQYNFHSWPYIAPVLKDCDMKVCVASEAICLVESHDIYVWILQQLPSMESRFDLSVTKLIFSDQFISQSVLERSGVSLTCLLQGDYYHNLEEVWPAYFGTIAFGFLRPHLQIMLLSIKKKSTTLPTRMQELFWPTTLLCVIILMPSITKPVTLLGTHWQKLRETWQQKEMSLLSRIIPVLAPILAMVMFGIFQSTLPSFVLASNK